MDDKNNLISRAFSALKMVHGAGGKPAGHGSPKTPTVEEYFSTMHCTQ